MMSSSEYRFLAISGPPLWAMAMAQVYGTGTAPGFAFEANGSRLTSCEVPHAHPLMLWLGFALEAEGKKFVYYGNAGLNSALEDPAKNADLLLRWC